MPKTLGRKTRQTQKPSNLIMAEDYNYRVNNGEKFRRFDSVVIGNYNNNNKNNIKATTTTTTKTAVTTLKQQQINRL